jgi:hypothetical protein
MNVEKLSKGIGFRKDVINEGTRMKTVNVIWEKDRNKSMCLIIAVYTS